MIADNKSLLNRAKEFAHYKGMQFSKWQEGLGLSNSHFYNCKGVSKKLYDILSARYPELDLEWLMTGKGFMLKGMPSRLDSSDVCVPVLPIAMTAEKLDLEKSFNDCEHIVSPIRGITFAMQVIGNSMAPDFPSGSYVFAQKVEDVSYVEWGAAYVIDTPNGVLIKHVFQSQEDINSIRCVSISPSNTPFEISKEKIKGWYKVRGCLILK